jgi:hypothetical protein
MTSTGTLPPIVQAFPGASIKPHQNGKKKKDLQDLALGLLLYVRPISQRPGCIDITPTSLFVCSGEKLRRRGCSTNMLIA